jgi:DNA repair exonuclease SbcCD ATPase subunit
MKIARLLPRCAAKPLPELPALLPTLRDTAAITRTGTRLAGHSAARERVQRELTSVEAELQQSDRDLESFAEEHGGLCPACLQGLPEELSGHHVHVEGRAA